MPETKAAGCRLIRQELARISKDKVRDIARQNVEAIRNSDRRGFRF